MKHLLTVLAVLLITSDTFPQTYLASNFTLIANINPETTSNPGGDRYSGCWGWYQSSKNKEYAIACGHAGTYWIDISNPATPTVSAYRAGLRTGVTWREAKTYQNYCYVISDDSGPNSFQIFDMQYLPDSVHKVYDGNSYFQRGHTLWIDGSKMYVGTVTYSNNTASSMNVYSLATPTAPLLIRSLTDDFPFVTRVHDMFVRRDTVFASCENQGLFVFNLDASGTFQQLGSLINYPFGGYNHSSSWTPDGKTLVFADELPPGRPLKVADVTNLSNIQITANTNQYTLTTPHNPYVVNNQYCFVASYEDGLQLYDISNPASPLLAGFYDTYYQAGGNTGTWTNGFRGLWGAYPYFPSKVIFALDQSNGVFLLKTHLYQNPPGTGLSEFNSGALLVYPNPARDLVRIRSTNGNLIKSISLNDASGRNLMTHDPGNLAETFDLNCRKLPPGIYFIKISDTSGGNSLKKLVISAE